MFVVFFCFFAGFILHTVRPPWNTDSEISWCLVWLVARPRHETKQLSAGFRPWCGRLMRRRGQVVGYGNLELWSDPGTVDKQEDAYNRWDPIQAPFTPKRPGKETKQKHWNLTVFDPCVASSSLKKRSNYPYFLCKPWVQLNDLNQTITSYCVSLGFLRMGACYFPSCHASLSPHKHPRGGEEKYYSLKKKKKALNISIHLSKKTTSSVSFIPFDCGSACSGSLPRCQIRKRVVHEYTAGYPHFVTLVPVWLGASTVGVNRVNTDRPCRC